MTGARKPEIDLLVLHDATKELRPLLGGDTTLRVRVIDDRELNRHPDHRGLEHWGWAGVDAPILSIPLDAPRSTAQVAFGWLAQHAGEAILAPAVTGGVPPPWWSLDLVLGERITALDLRGARWHDRAGLWWANGTGPVRLPITAAGRSGSTAADLLRSLQQAPVNETVNSWLDDVAERHDHPGDAEWDAALCANYLNFALAHLTEPKEAALRT